MCFGYGYLEVLVLLPAVPDFEVQEPPVVLELHLLVLELADDLLLLVALAPDIHAPHPQVPDLLLQRLQLRLLQGLQLLLVGLLLEPDQLLLDLEHVKAVSRQEVTLVLLQD